MARALAVRSRFIIAYLLLGAAVGGGLGAFIVLLQRPGPKPPSPWSVWKPATASVGGTAQAIASHIGGYYRLPDGHQLARIVLDTPNQAAGNVEAIALAHGSNSVTLYDPNQTVLYTLCGSAKNCTLTEGPSISRRDVLRREALELALYTLKYAKVADVAVFFPPVKGDKTSTNVLFFPREDFARQLSRPLKVTLPHALPPTRGRIDPRELQTIDELTGGHRFHFAVQTIQNRRVLVLQPAA
jgi:hypothetical protein